LVGEFRGGADQFADGVVGAQQGPQLLLGAVGGLGSQHDAVTFELGLERTERVRQVVLIESICNALNDATLVVPTTSTNYAVDESGGCARRKGPHKPEDAAPSDPIDALAGAQRKARRKKGVIEVDPALDVVEERQRKYVPKDVHLVRTESRYQRDTRADLKDELPCAEGNAKPHWNPFDWVYRSDRRQRRGCEVGAQRVMNPASTNASAMRPSGSGTSSNANPYRGPPLSIVQTI